MRKTMVIAAREYNAAVRTKAFIVSVVLLPIMMGGSILAQLAMQKYAADIDERKIAVVDRTSGQQLFDVLEIEAKKRNDAEITDTKTGKQTQPKFTLIRVEPSAPDAAAIDAQRFELSEQVRKKQIFAFIEIGSDVLTTTRPAATTTAATGGGASGGDADRFIVRYASNSPTYMAVQNWAQRAISNAATQRKIEALGIPRDKANALLTRTAVVPMALAQKDAAGVIKAREEQNQAVAIALPIGVIFLMFVIVIVGSSPMMMNVMEEKQQRIAEVLLGSVRPFDLMLGKLLGGVGVALTLMAIYFAGAYWAAHRFSVAKYIEPQLMLWFALFSIVSVFMFGSMFVAVGSAVSNAREAQSLMTPLMMLIVIPMMVLGPILQSPNGKVATALSFFPPSAPMVSMVRMSVPPGAPLWQPLASLVLAALTTILIVWCAGRIFRVGILMQGQGAKLGEMMRWVVRG